MLTGQRPFDGRDVSETIGAVLQLEPEWDALPGDTPSRVSTLLRRCLEKEPRGRVQAIGDVRLAMEGAFETTVRAPSEQSVAPQLQLWQRPVPALIIVLIVAVITGLAVWSLTRPDVIQADLMRFVIAPPDTAPLDVRGNLRDLAIAPDGTKIIYISPDPSGSAPQLNLRPVNQLVSEPLRGAEGGIDPFVSPDGAWVGFVDDATNRLLQKVSILGGPPVTLTESPSPVRGASWGTDDRIIFGTQGGGLFRVSGGGGEPEALTTLDTEQGEFGHYWPFIVPNQEAVVLTISYRDSPTNRQLAVLDLDTGEVTRLGLAGVSPHYVSTGHLVYAAEDGSVRAVPFDATSLEVMGNPVPMVEAVIVKGGGAADFSISDNGRLVYAVGEGGGLARHDLVWVDREGREEPLGYEARPLRGGLAMSPDGNHLVVSVDPYPRDLWIYDLRRGTEDRLTVDDGDEFAPVFTRDGERVGFSGSVDGTAQGGVFWTAAGMPGGAELVTSSAMGEGILPQSFMLNDEKLIVKEDGAAAFGDDENLGLLALDTGERTMLLDGPFRERSATLSPNGDWLAHQSDQTGTWEVYVRPFPNVNSDQQVVSIGGGWWPRWGLDGRELFYVSGQGLMTVTIEAGARLTLGRPELVLAMDAYVSGSREQPRMYDISPIDQRFLMVKPERESGVETADLAVVLNWLEELKRLVPVP